MAASPRRLLRPILMLVVPLVLLIGACSLWLGPWASATADKMVEDANRSVVIAGLEPGQFTPLSSGGVVYLNTVSQDGKQLGKVFMQREKDGRLDVITADRGEVYLEGNGRRFLRLRDGYRVEGPTNATDLDYRLMRYETSESALPDSSATHDENDPEVMSTARLIADPRPEAKAQLHLRIAPPLLALAFALMALPLSRSAPRQQRYGRMMLAFLGYVVGSNMSTIGARWIADGRIPAAAGLWWLTLPLLVLAIWLYARDGRMGRPRRTA
jgi:lipopolysaccharide export system permease protein